ncbi:MAG TPA: prepilin-type N-terminal cleavage/methylation domain-containing protein [Candidatus Saccharimonadales bacterium]
MKRSLSGFTIVELLIVIVVIAILAAITVVAYNGIQNRANAASVSTSLKNIEKSLRAYSAEQGWSVWPRDNAVISGQNNPSIQLLITSLPGFNQYMQTAPTITGVPAASWTYDNDGDTKPTCGADGTRYNGTNIVLTGVTEAMADAIDKSIDDGSNSCGKIRFELSTLKLFYNLSLTDTL